MNRPEKAVRQVFMHSIGTPVLSFYSPTLHSIITYGDPRRGCQGHSCGYKAQDNVTTWESSAPKLHIEMHEGY